MPAHQFNIIMCMTCNKCMLQVSRPVRVDLSTGEIINASMPQHKFKITFEHSGVRDNLKMLEIAARVTEVRGLSEPSSGNRARGSPLRAMLLWHMWCMLH